jgi:Protein of unknown function (DUF1353)
MASLSAKILQTPGRFDRVDRVKQTVGPPVLPGDDRFWILGDPLIIEVDDERIEVPVGFTTDGASVPGWAQRLTGWKPWTDPPRWASVAHDGCTPNPAYPNPTLTRSSAPCWHHKERARSSAI